MIELRFRKEAEADLEQILAYHREVAADAVPNIQSDISHALTRLLEFPRIGAPVAGRPFRRLVTLRYRFKIAYLIEGNSLTILGIFRFQDRES
jgi:plasmid stabilization system protein ParE